MERSGFPETTDKGFAFSGRDLGYFAAVSLRGQIGRQ
jgi:hypothetical protein